MVKSLKNELHNDIRRKLLSASFLKRSKIQRESLEQLITGREFPRDLESMVHQLDFSAKTLLTALKKSMTLNAALQAVEVTDIYEYLIKHAFKDSRDRSFTREEIDFIGVFITIYKELLKWEKKSEADEFFIQHQFEFLGREEIESLEDDEYRKFLRAFDEDHIYEIMRLSMELYGFNTLDHVAGVHFVGNYISKQVLSLGLPIDRGRVSGALAGHDIGKYGVRLSEMGRVPYLHYYYSDIWFKKHGINYIRNVAVNHSTWDLELENLSLEALILIYSDFRVKNRRIDGKDQMHIYSLEDSFHVILEKLDNVDDAKRRRYEKVYSKLKDFEDYLVALGVDTDVYSPLNNKVYLHTRREVLPLKSPSLCFDQEVVDRLKYHAIEHNIKVMHLLRNEYSMETLLEEARSLRDWRDLREYIRILEEYSTYLTQGQKLLLISFLKENLVHPEDDIRHHSGEIIGKLIGTFDEDYRKELPLEETPPSSSIVGRDLLNATLKEILFPNYKVIESHKFLLGYSLSGMMRHLFRTLPRNRVPEYVEVILSYYTDLNVKNELLSLFLMAALKYIPCDVSLKEAYIMKMLGGGLIQRISAMEILTSIYLSENFSREFVEGLRKRLRKIKEDADITEVYLHLKLAGQLHEAKKRQELEDVLRARKGEVSDIYLNNLKTATHWIVKRNNIRLLLYYTLTEDSMMCLNNAIHLCNLLKVSAIESVRRTAGNALLNLMGKLSYHERNEVSVELLRALEIDGHRFTEYIPKPLGKSLLFLKVKEFDEVIDDLLVKVKTSTSSVKSLILKTLGTALESFVEFGFRGIEVSEEERVHKIKSMLRVLLYGLADYDPLTVRSAFTTIGKVLFASPNITDSHKKELFLLTGKKLITLMVHDEKDLLFLSQSAGLNHIYRFISEYTHAYGIMSLSLDTKYAFFPGTFDPFTISHREIAMLIRDMGYEVYLSVDEFSWSKRTLPNKVRRSILNMSTAGELGLYVYPEDIPVNLANEADIRTLKDSFNGDVVMVCGSDVVLNASSYRKPPTKDSIHTLKHLVFERTKRRHSKDIVRSLVQDVDFLDLPKDLKEVSSSQIRLNIDENRDISSLIDPLAQKYIYTNGFYQKTPTEKAVLELSFLEKKIVPDFDKELEDVILELFPKNYEEIAQVVRTNYTRPSGRVLVLRDRNSDAPVGISVFHWVRSENILAEVSDPQLAHKIRERNLGRIIVMDGLFVKPVDRVRNYSQILLTETLAFALSRDYEYALFLPKHRLLTDESFISLLELYNFTTIEDEVRVHYVDMSTPIVLNLDMDNILKDPFRTNPKLRHVIEATRRKLQKAICSLYPGHLVLPFEPLMLHQGMIQTICTENNVGMKESTPRVLGDLMCVPYGDILDRELVPNTVTKSLHTEKYFNSDMLDFTIKEVPFYLSLENQVKTLKSFNRPVLLVDTLLHKGYRMKALNPLLQKENIEVRKIITGILSARGLDLMTSKGYKVESVYYIPRLKVWFNESDLYPFIGGNALWRGSFPERNLIPSINLILPYTSPNFLLDAGNKAVFELSRVSMENALDILKVIEEEFHKVYERKLTLSSLGQVFTMPRCPDKGKDIVYDLYRSPSYYLESDREHLMRIERLVR